MTEENTLLDEQEKVYPIRLLMLFSSNSSYKSGPSTLIISAHETPTISLLSTPPLVRIPYGVA